MFLKLKYIVSQVSVLLVNFNQKLDVNENTRNKDWIRLNSEGSKMNTKIVSYPEYEFIIQS